MIKLLLYNTDNDKECEIELPAIPRIGDWINISSLEDDFIGEDDETSMTVEFVNFYSNSDTVKVFITSD
jgi:hypothetical protein